MLLISYKNVMNGFNSGISMSCICPTQKESYFLFCRAIDIWHIEGFSEVSYNKQEIRYGPSADKLSLKFRSILGMVYGESWKGFRGVYLFHPKLEQNQVTDKEQRLRSEINHQNERYLDKWRA